MDRNTIIGFGLIFLILIGFYFYTKPTEQQLAEQQRVKDSIELAEKAVQKNTEARPAQAQATISQVDSSASNVNSNSAFTSQGEAKEIVLKNNELALVFNSKGGNIQQIELLNHKRWDKQKLLLFNQSLSQFGFEINTAKGPVNTKNLVWNIVSSTDSSATFRIQNSDSGYIEHRFVLPSKGFQFRSQLVLNKVQNDIYRGNADLKLLANPILNKQEKQKKWEQEKSDIYYKQEGESPDNLGTGESEKEELKGKTQWVSFKQQYFNFTIAHPAGFDSDSKLEHSFAKADTIVRLNAAQLYLPYNLEQTKTYDFNYYAGPNDIETLENTNLGMDKTQLNQIVPLGWGIFGWVNEYLVLPVFTFLSKSISNMGIAILLLTLFIKFLLLPFVYKSYIGTAKMRILKPDIDAIKAKYPSDLQKQQTENMNIYKKAGVSPMSGCVPMLFQMPVLFAMFQFFPVAFNLRQKSFLWSTDLSAYDSVLDFGFNIPFYGDHVSLFTVLMTVSTLIYTYFNNQISGVSGQMKYIGYFMPIIFLGVLNDFASGLTWYYFVSNIVTFLQQWLIRKRVDDNKLLAQITNARKKTPTKSKFQQRMEEAMKQQQARNKKK